VLVEALGVGAGARERMHLAGVTFERLLAAVFQMEPEGAGLPALASRAIVGGVRQVVFIRTLEGRQSELYALTDEVLDWIESYRWPAAARLGSGAVSQGSRRLPTARAAFLQGEGSRARALGSLVDLTLDGGYAPLSDPQIAQFAGISTEVFHQHFSDKERLLSRRARRIRPRSALLGEGAIRRGTVLGTGGRRGNACVRRIPRRPPGSPANRLHRPLRGRPQASSVG